MAAGLLPDDGRFVKLLSPDAAFLEAPAVLI
jgi:hypothetical protein